MATLKEAGYTAQRLKQQGGGRAALEWPKPGACPRASREPGHGSPERAARHCDHGAERLDTCTGLHTPAAIAHLADLPHDAQQQQSQQPQQQRVGRRRRGQHGDQH